MQSEERVCVTLPFLSHPLAPPPGPPFCLCYMLVVASDSIARFGLVVLWLEGREGGKEGEMISRG